MKLTTKEATELLNALCSLNGQPKAITVNGQQAVIIDPYSLSSKIRATIARNIARLTLLVAAHDRAKAVVMSNLNPTDPDAESVCALLDDDEHEIALNEISEADLQLHVNAIAPTALAAMAPIVSDWREEAPAIDFASLEMLKGLNHARPAGHA